MKGQRIAVYAGVLAAALVTAVAGLAAGTEQPSPERRVLRLDGRGGQLGVMVSDGDGNAGGVRVDEVERDSPAEKAGVQSGDIVVEFDGERVRSARQLTRLVQETPAGHAVTMVVKRGEARQSLNVTPEARETFVWNGGLSPDLEREIERGVEQGLRDLPDRIEPFLNFRMEGLPGMGLGARGRLGVSAVPMSAQLAEHFGATAGGVLVSSVTADSPAAKAGLKAGDVITKVNGEAVRDSLGLVRALGDVTGDGAITLDIVRDRKATTLEATIEPRRPGPPARGRRPA